MMRWLRLEAGSGRGAQRHAIADREVRGTEAGITAGDQGVARKRDKLKAGRGSPQLLHVAADTRLGYRRVYLACGTHVLSEAENWYVPERLTPEMNRTFDTSEIAIRRGGQAAQFPSQDPEDAEPLDEREHCAQGDGAAGDGEAAPFSLVVENYSANW